MDDKPVATLGNNFPGGNVLQLRRNFAFRCGEDAKRGSCC